MQKKKLTDILLLTLLALMVVTLVLMASVPPVSRDALTHHLAVPKLYLHAGGIYEIPEIIFSYYPMNIDLLYLVPLYFGNDIIPKYIHLVFGLMTAWLVFSFIRRRTGERRWGLLGALLYLSLPIIVKLSITVYVDLGLVYFSTAALFYLLKWSQNGYHLRHLLIAAICCGFCMGTKYNGLIVFFLLTCLVPLLYFQTQRQTVCEPSASGRDRIKHGALIRSDSFKVIGSAAIFLIVSILIFSPWMIRNYRWTGNPLYPLYQGAFTSMQHQSAAAPSAVRPLESNQQAPPEKLSHFVVRKRVFDESLIEAATIPVRIFFQGRDDNPKYFDGRLNPYLLLFPILSFVGFRRFDWRVKVEHVVLAGFSVLFLLYTFFKIDMRIRYIAPIIPPLVVLSVMGFRRTMIIASGLSQGFWRKAVSSVVTVLLVGLLALNAVYIFDQFRHVDPINYINGTLPRDQYITRYRDEYPSYQFINRQLPASAMVLGLYLGDRSYYSDRKLFFSDEFFSSVVKQSSSADHLLEILHSRGFTHLFIRSDFFQRFLVAHLDDIDKRKLEAFAQNHTTRLFSDGVFMVLRLDGQN